MGHFFITLFAPPPQFVVREVADVTAGRRPIKRSILSVCEHFANKPNAADAPLSLQIVIYIYSFKSAAFAVVANNNVERVYFVCLHLLPRLEVGGEYCIER